MGAFKATYPPGTNGKLTSAAKKSTIKILCLNRARSYLWGLPEISDWGFIAMLQDGVFSFFWRSQDSTLSRKARVKNDSVMNASLQPRNSLEMNVAKPAKHTQLSSNRQGTAAHRLMVTNTSKATEQRRFLHALINLPSKCEHALLLQLALIRQILPRQPLLSPWPLSSVGVITLTSLAALLLLSAFSWTHICPNALKPNPNQRIWHSFTRSVVLVRGKSCWMVGEAQLSASYNARKRNSWMYHACATVSL